MRALLQRVSQASVRVDGDTVGEIGPGLLVLLGVGHADDEQAARALAAKVGKLRVFADQDGKMNRSLLDVGGAVLSVSQFTLYGETRRGNRPSFTAAASPEQGRRLYGAFNAALRAHGVEVQEGVFGAHMQLSLVNDGPVTLLLELPVPGEVPGGSPG